MQPTYQPPAAVPRALVVEDFHAHALAAASHLRQAGFAVQCAPSLAEGLARAEDMLEHAGEYPLLILIDLHLPIPRSPAFDDRAAMTEGAALAAYLRPRLGDRALLAAYTSDPGAESQQEAALAGCRVVLSKPFRSSDAAELRALVESLALGELDDPALEVELSGAAPVRRSGLLGGVQRMLERAATRIISYAALSEAPPAPPAQAALAEARTMHWDPGAVRTLLLNYPDLFDAYPAAGAWIERQGGLEQVLERVRDSCRRFPQAQQQILAELLAHPVAGDWDRMAQNVGLAKSAFYRHRQKLFRALASEMNAWR